MLSALDSFFVHVKNRIVTANPERDVVGILEAQDWPQQITKSDAFYCLASSGAVPVGPGSFSPSAPLMSVSVQWLWAIFGTDIASGIRGRSRGDRYRVHQTMRGELVNALYPYYAEKLNYSAPQGQLTGVSLDPQEFITWSAPTFVDRVDPESGLVYGTARVSISDIAAAIAA